MDIEIQDAIKVLAHKIFETFRENNCYPISLSSFWTKEELISMEYRMHFSRINIFDEYEDFDSFLKDNIVFDLATLPETYLCEFVKTHFDVGCGFSNKLNKYSYLTSQEIEKARSNWTKLKSIYQLWKDLTKEEQDKFFSIWDFIETKIQISEIL